MKKTGQCLVGFALETDNGPANAAEKLRRKNLDMIVLNSLADPGAGFGTDTNKISVFYAEPAKEAQIFGLKSKAEVAADIFDCIDNL